MVWLATWDAGRKSQNPLKVGKKWGFFEPEVDFLFEEIEIIVEEFWVIFVGSNYTLPKT